MQIAKEYKFTMVPLGGFYTRGCELAAAHNAHGMAEHAISEEKSPDRRDTAPLKRDRRSTHKEPDDDPGPRVQAVGIVQQCDQHGQGSCNGPGGRTGQRRKPAAQQRLKSIDPAPAEYGNRDDRYENRGRERQTSPGFNGKEPMISKSPARNRTEEQHRLHQEYLQLPRKSIWKWAARRACCGLWTATDRPRSRTQCSVLPVHHPFPDSNLRIRLVGSASLTTCRAHRTHRTWARSRRRR